MDFSLLLCVCLLQESVRHRTKQQVTQAKGCVVTQGPRTQLCLSPPPMTAVSPGRCTEHLLLGQEDGA